jgi:hypothetical protein
MESNQMADTSFSQAGADRQPTPVRAVKNLVKARTVVAIMATAAILSGNWPVAAMVAGCWLFRRRKHRRCGQAKPA